MKALTETKGRAKFSSENLKTNTTKQYRSNMVNMILIIGTLYAKVK